MVGCGQYMDLIKLFLNVKRKGGYNRVTENGLWDFVAKECGFVNVSDGLALKLVYVENLEKIFESLKRFSDEKNVVERSISDTCGGCSMDLSSNLEPFLSEVLDIEKKNDVNYVKVDWDECDSDGVCVEKLPEMVYCRDPVKSDEDIENYHMKHDVIDLVDINWGDIRNVNEECDASSGGCSMDTSSNMEPFLSEVSDIIKTNDATYVKLDLEKLPEIDHSYDRENYHTKRVLPNVKKECLTSVEFKPIKTAVFRKKSVAVIDKGSDSICCLKRKRESAIGILDWIHKVARDPCDPAIGSLPESSEWKDYATDVIWKQVLLIHEAMLLKRIGYSDGQHFTMQKRQKMHPTMYDEPEKFRQSQRIHSAKDPLEKPLSRNVSKSSSPPEFPDYLSNKHHQIHVNIGQNYQADVHEWTEKKKSLYEVDSKWSGTPIWPLVRVSEHNKNLIEREPLGKGRSDSCGCQFPGSTECVRFHVSEKSKRLKLELGSAFYLWRFNRMGEDTSVTWTKEEENKFLDTWKLNPVLSLNGFLDQSVKALPNKSRALLVNYYFNVYLLRRRGEQNRISPNNITSDDEDDGKNEDTKSARVKPTTVSSTKETRSKKSR